MGYSGVLHFCPHYLLGLHSVTYISKAQKCQLWKTARHVSGFSRRQTTGHGHKFGEQTGWGTARSARADTVPSATGGNALKMHQGIMHSPCVTPAHHHAVK